MMGIIKFLNIFITEYALLYRFGRQNNDFNVY